MNHLTTLYKDIRKKNQSNQWQHKGFLSYLTLFALLFGILVRVAQYISNRSLWSDEAWLATNIMHRSYGQLLQRLDHHQAAPAGFLWVQKTITLLLGESEYAFRLLPLVSGILSLFALYYVGKLTLSKIAIPIALILFATLKFPLYYATEVKQYSSDVLISLLISLLLLSLRGQLLSKSRVLVLGGLGALALFFSHTAIFVIVGMEVALLITTPAEKRKAIFLNRWPAYLIWLVSFIAIYLLITSHSSSNRKLYNAWKREYPGSVFNIVWLLDSFGRFFSHPLGFPGISDGVAIFAFILGGVSFWKRDKALILIVLAPVFATLVATYLHIYPFRTRLILFLTPFFILFIAEGAAYVWEWSRQRKMAPILAVTVIGSLILPSIVQAGSLLFYPETRYEVRPVMEYIKAHQQSGDVLYAHGALTGAQLRYYADRFGYSKSEYVVGYNDFLKAEPNADQVWEEFRKPHQQLQPQQRVWFLFGGMRQENEGKQVVEPRLDRIGQRLDSTSAPRAFTYLYQLK